MKNSIYRKKAEIFRSPLFMCNTYVQVSDAVFAIESGNNFVGQIINTIRFR